MLQTTYRDYIIAMCEELDLIDILRKKKPNAKLFTYESKPLRMKSRTLSYRAFSA